MTNLLNNIFLLKLACSGCLDPLPEASGALRVAADKLSKPHLHIKLALFKGVWSASGNKRVLNRKDDILPCLFPQITSVFQLSETCPK